MAKIEVMPTELIAQSLELHALATAYQSLFSEINGILLDVNDGWSEKLSNNFSGKIMAAQACGDDLVEMLCLGARVAQASALKLMDTDEVLAAMILQDWIDKSKEPESELEKFVWKVVGQYGILGQGLKTLHSIGNLSEDGSVVDKAFDIGKDVAKTVQKTASSMAQEVFDWKTLIGGSSAAKDATTKGWWSNFKSGLKKDFSGYKVGTGASAAKKVSVVAKWAGPILTVGSEAYENFTDKENETFGRKLAETVGESVISFGSTAVIGAGVAVGVAAIGVTGGVATAVVGAATVGISVGVDKVTEALSDGEKKDFNEAVSDGILDLGEKAIQKGTKTVGALWKKITD